MWGKSVGKALGRRTYRVSSRTLQARYEQEWVGYDPMRGREKKRAGSQRQMDTSSTLSRAPHPVPLVPPHCLPHPLTNLGDPSPPYPLPSLLALLISAAPLPPSPQVPSMYNNRVLVHMFNGGRQDSIFTYINATLAEQRTFSAGTDFQVRGGGL